MVKEELKLLYCGKKRNLCLNQCSRLGPCHSKLSSKLPDALPHPGDADSHGRPRDASHYLERNPFAVIPNFEEDNIGLLVDFHARAVRPGMLVNVRQRFLNDP